MKIFGGALLFGAAASAALAQAPAAVNRAKLESLHDAGKAFQRALEDPNASLPQVLDLRQKLEHEAARWQGVEVTPDEKRIISLYGAAAHDYDDARDHFLNDRSRDRFLAAEHLIEAQLTQAETIYQAAPATPAPAAPPVAPPPPPPPPKKPPLETVPAPVPRREPPAPPVAPPPPPAKSPEPPTHAPIPIAPPPSRTSAPPPAPPPPLPAPAPPPPVAPPPATV
ncbi:MAG TPA: hypothetical protein VFL12_00175, partial [Thermoanaerobaculia bacterium]|nr:hypothetical protein [Thermoanaerobaculia bacterium]